MTSMDRIFYAMLFIFFHISASFSFEAYIKWISSGEKLPIGIEKFVISSEEEKRRAEELLQVLVDDLYFSGYFTIIVKETHSAVVEQQLYPNFSYWADEKPLVFIIIGRVAIEGTNISFWGKAYDISSKKEILSMRYKASKDNVRYISHRFADDIIEKLLGRKGIASTKISFTYSISPNTKEIYIMDYDGYNKKRVTFNKSISILPKWLHYKGKNLLLYTSYVDKNPDLYMLDLEKGWSDVVSKIQGLNLVGKPALDGKYLPLVMTLHGNPEIYIFSLESRTFSRVTYHRAIDTSPSFSPSGDNIAFISDRAGLPQVYIMDKDGVNVRRLTYEGYCDSPDWSPTGELIAYTCRKDINSGFQIYVITADGSKVEQLTSVGNNENPSFSPDGRCLVYSSLEKDKYVLKVINIETKFIKTVCEMENSCLSPSWSQ
jgi:TolB protein